MLDWSLDECVQSVPEGWSGLIKSLYTNLDGLPVRINVQQIKSKFGGLRFYYEVESKDQELYDAIIRIVDEAEGKSYEICEDCGQPGSLKQVGYWLTTQCEACNIKALEVRKNLWKDA